MTERFTLLSELGRGGMGVVWKARDEETGRIVALKLLHAAYALDPDYVTRFERELELARRIHSAHVVEVLGYGVRDGAPYLALEYVDGPTLREQLASHGPYTWPEAKAILAQIAQGLADAHAAGVVHRDLKPSNVLIGSDGVAKIADFGIAKGFDLTRVTGTSTLLGTPAYLAPEGPIDERSDLYSLGIVAYELLTGAAPFTGTTYQEVIVRHIREAPNLAKLPAEARDIVGWLLAKDPEQRPQRAGQLLPVLWGGAPVPPAAPPAAALVKGQGTVPPTRPVPPTLPVPRVAEGNGSLAGGWSESAADQAPPSDEPEPSPADNRPAGAVEVSSPAATPTWSGGAGSATPTLFAAPQSVIPPAVVPSVPAPRQASPGPLPVQIRATGEDSRQAAAPTAAPGHGPQPTPDSTSPARSRRLTAGILLAAGLVIVLVLAGSFIALPRFSGGAASPTVAATIQATVAANTGRAATPAPSLAAPKPAMASPVPPTPTGPTGVWESLGSLPEGAQGDTAFQLPDGRVLIFSTSSSPNIASGSSWLVDIATGTVQVGPLMAALRLTPAAVELDNGSVLVVGGWNKSHAPISSAEMFDASTIQWVSVAPMQLPRSQATVTNLGGGRILVAGGWISHNSDGGWTATSSAEIYDPGTGTWSYTGSMSMPRALASATLLADGRVLVAGGDQAWVGSTGESVLSSAEVYDPRAGTWSAAGNMSSPRAAQFAGRLPDGRVLVSGGWAGGQKHGIASADIYDPASGWSGAAPMPAALAQGRAVTLLDGRLMVIGGLDAAAGITSMVEIFDPGSMSWQRTGTLMQAVYWPAAVALRDGRVLVAGGGADSQTSRVLQICTPPSL